MCLTLLSDDGGDFVYYEHHFTFLGRCYYLLLAVVLVVAEVCAGFVGYIICMLDRLS